MIYALTHSIGAGTMILENAAVVASIPARHKFSASYYHSFGATEDSIVFIEQPLYVDDGARNGHTAANNLKWKKAEMVRHTSQKSNYLINWHLQDKILLNGLK